MISVKVCWSDSSRSSKPRTSSTSVMIFVVDLARTNVSKMHLTWWYCLISPPVLLYGLVTTCQNTHTHTHTHIYAQIYCLISALSVVTTDWTQVSIKNLCGRPDVLPDVKSIVSNDKIVCKTKFKMRNKFADFPAVQLSYPTADNWRAPWKNRISSTSMKLRKSLVKPVTWQNISSCSVLSPEIVMHDTFNVILWTSADICVVVRDDLGWKNRTTRNRFWRVDYNT